MNLKTNKPNLIFLTILLSFSLFTLPVNAVGVDPGLGSARPYGILGATATVTESTAIVGSLGTGGLTGTATVTGSTDVANEAYDVAFIDFNAAMNNVISQASDFTLSTLGGNTLTPGVYKFNNAVTIGSSITLEGDGIYIFQIGGALTTAAGTQIQLQGGAQACNVYWVAEAATIGANSVFTGTLMSKSAITVGANSVTSGRMLAKTAVTANAADTQILVPQTCTTPASIPDPESSLDPQLPLNPTPDPDPNQLPNPTPVPEEVTPPGPVEAPTPVPEIVMPPVPAPLPDPIPDLEPEPVVPPEPEPIPAAPPEPEPMTPVPGIIAPPVLMPIPIPDFEPEPAVPPEPAPISAAPPEPEPMTPVPGIIAPPVLMPNPIPNLEPEPVGSPGPAPIPAAPSEPTPIPEPEPSEDGNASSLRIEINPNGSMTIFAALPDDTLGEGTWIFDIGGKIYESTGNETIVYTVENAPVGTYLVNVQFVSDNNGEKIDVGSATVSVPTVTGGQLPKTATPWYNFLFGGSVLLLVGLIFLKRRKMHE